VTARLVDKVHDFHSLTLLDACFVVACRSLATVGILNDAVLIDPEKVDVDRSHVIEDAI
jgi:hypothetical protein